MEQPALAAWAPRTKLARPPLAPDVVLDDDLVERVVQLASTQPLTLVVDAAGSGKTTLVAAAAERLDRVAWLRLDGLDDEPVAVLELLVDAVGPVVAGGCPTAHALLARGLPPTVDPRRAAALLVNDLARHAESLVLSVNTVKTHVRNVLTKLGAASRGEAVAAARRHHLV